MNIAAVLHTTDYASKCNTISQAAEITMLMEATHYL